jgi:mevalonate pyrophosphate decarboxylase
MFQWTLLELACSVFLNELSDGSFNTMTGGPYIYIYIQKQNLKSRFDLKNDVGEESLFV